MDRRPSQEEQRWQAVSSRAYGADFFYAVVTTGIFCRPGCASRLPNRDNVRYFDCAEKAVLAGFRACMRCRPLEAPSDQPHHQAIIGSCRLIDAADELPSIDELAQNAGLSRYHFQRLFKGITGVTPKAYLTYRRMERARRELRRPQSVLTALHESGFNSSARFYAAARGQLGMTPKVYRDRARGVVISYALGSCSLGSILAAATDVGLCAVLIGDSEHELIQELSNSFPNGRLVSADKRIESLLQEVIATIDRSSDPTALPLDVRGTAFQIKVWEALRTVRSGEVLSYQQLAAKLGCPTAVRAVASACAANTLAVLIPCHRVTRSDGSLAGYRWGVGRKAALLERERLPHSISPPRRLPRKRDKLLK